MKPTIVNDRPSEGFFKNIVTKVDAAISAGRAEIVSGPAPQPRESTLTYTSPEGHGEVDMAAIQKGLDKPGEPSIPDKGWPPNPVLGGGKP